MSLKLRPDRHLYGAYNYLRLTEPFFGLKPKLPEADEVKFIVSRERKTQGFFRMEDGFPSIGISSFCTGSSQSLIEIMAHEIIHLFQWAAKSETANTQHNAEFIRLSKRVCKAHGFDIKTFIGDF